MFNLTCPLCGVTDPIRSLEDLDVFDEMHLHEDQRRETTLVEDRP